MPWKGLNNNWKVILVIAVVLLLTASVVWFFHPLRRLADLAPGAEAPPPPLDREEKLMPTKEEKVQTEMEKVIRNWCDAEPLDYNAQKSLEGLWIGRFGTALPYVPNGIGKLVNKIHDNEFFERCQFSPGLFMPGGGIQTVGDLHFFLSPCAKNT
jgi:hypothetical protein